MEEIADATEFLLSNTGINAQNRCIDGGLWSREPGAGLHPDHLRYPSPTCRSGFPAGPVAPPVGGGNA